MNDSEDDASIHKENSKINHPAFTLEAGAAVELTKI